MPRRATILFLLVAAACGRADNPGLSSRGSSSAATDSTGIAVSGEWPADLGSALLVPADTENLAVVLYPASPAATVDPESEVMLFAANGDAIRLRAAVSGDSAQCGDAPLLRFSRAIPLVWSLGVAGSKARSIVSDSMDVLSTQDSVLFTSEGARLASIVVAGVLTRLSGLPFSLAAVRRIRFGDTTIIAAQLVRRVNQEANPAEERTLVVAERIGAERFTMAHGVRSEGTEETVDHHDLIGAFRSAGGMFLVVSTESPAGSKFEILERSGGAWRVRWTRGIAC